MGMKRAWHGKHEECRSIVVSMPEGNRPLGKLRCEWKDYISLDLKIIWVWVWTTGLI